MKRLICLLISVFCLLSFSLSHGLAYESDNFIKEVNVTSKANEFKIELIADSAISDYFPFTLTDPARLVIDMPLTEAKIPKTYSLDNLSYPLLRWGIFKGNLRVVIDATIAEIPPYKITAKDNILEIIFPLEEPSISLIPIKAIDFEQISPKRCQLVVASEGELQYEIFRPELHRLIFQLINVNFSSSLLGEIETKEFPCGVKRVLSKAIDKTTLALKIELKERIPFKVITTDKHLYLSFDVKPIIIAQKPLPFKKETIKEIPLQRKEEVVPYKAEEVSSEELSSLVKALKGLKVGALWYLDFKAGQDKGADHYSDWNITRGYINIEKELTPWFHARVTPDVTREADGDVKVRLKYLYGRFYLPSFSFFTNNFIEIGQIHIPWLDFEEHINPYRAQGTMFLERNNMFNSADQGIALFGYLGGEMSKAYKERVNKHYAGRYGSYALGVYNGGGYHQWEKNTNKALEGRLTLRPLPDILPGLQFSYHGIFGKGNLNDDGETYKDGRYAYWPGTDVIATGDPPDWHVNQLFISYERPLYTMTLQFAKTKGSQNGYYEGPGGKYYRDERDKEGFSVFGMYKLPFYKKLRLWARYDYWNVDLDEDDDIERRAMGAISYDIYKECFFLVALERLWHDNPSYHDEHFFQTVLQIKF